VEADYTVNFLSVAYMQSVACVEEWCFSADRSSSSSSSSSVLNLVLGTPSLRGGEVRTAILAPEAENVNGATRITGYLRRRGQAGSVADGDEAARKILNAVACEPETVELEFEGAVEDDAVPEDVLTQITDEIYETLVDDTLIWSLVDSDDLADIAVSGSLAHLVVDVTIDRDHLHDESGGTLQEHIQDILRASIDRQAIEVRVQSGSVVVVASGLPLWAAHALASETLGGRRGPRKQPFLQRLFDLLKNETKELKMRPLVRINGTVMVLLGATKGAETPIYPGDDSEDDVGRVSEGVPPVYTSEMFDSVSELYQGNELTQGKQLLEENGHRLTRQTLELHGVPCPRQMADGRAARAAWQQRGGAIVASTSSELATTTSAAMPEHLICPITQQMLVDPVSCSDGHTYSRVEIEKWLETHQTSPLTNLPLSNKTLTPNFVVRSAVAAWRPASPGIGVVPLDLNVERVGVDR
jgi:hypothetical protein